jgi:hypothetical protein
MSSAPDVPKLPHLIFLALPKNWEANPPLASSLQHLETSLLLIALGRYPHALVSCVSAIESALKAAFKIPAEEERTLMDLLDQASKKFPSHVGFKAKDVADLRRKRNAITHFGFSPNDDEVAAALLLDVGYTYLDQCYRTFFGFNTIRKTGSFDGYSPDVFRLLGASLNVWRSSKSRKQIAGPAPQFFIPVAHGVRWSTQHWSMSRVQQNILDDATESFDQGFAVIQLLEQLKNKMVEPVGVFDCPVCGYGDCVCCELDGGDSFDSGDLKVTRMICAHCSLNIPSALGDLAAELVADQIPNRKVEICKGYGVHLKAES